MSDIPEAAVEAVLGTQHIQDHLGGSIDADDVRSILEAAMPAIRQQVDAQPEVIDAWYALVDHEAFTPCRDEEAPLLDSMLDRLTNLVDIESAVTELRRSSADDEIRADERRRIAEKEREMSERKYTIPEAAVEVAAFAALNFGCDSTPEDYHLEHDPSPDGLLLAAQVHALLEIGEQLRVANLIALDNCYPRISAEALFASKEDWELETLQPEIARVLGIGDDQ